MNNCLNKSRTKPTVKLETMTGNIFIGIANQIDTPISTKKRETKVIINDFILRIWLIHGFTVYFFSD